jgi:hypothetical protein
MRSLKIPLLALAAGLAFTSLGRAGETKDANAQCCDCCAACNGTHQCADKCAHQAPASSTEKAVNQATESKAGKK